MDNVEQRFRLDKARKYLNSVETLQHLPETNHVCSFYSVSIELDLDEIVESKSELPISVRQGMLYIAGYVMRQLPALNDLLEENDTTEKYTKCG